MSLHERLRAMAARVCSAPTMERLIDPVLTDVQIDHADAMAQGRVWRGRWIRMVGYLAFLKVIGLLGCERTVRGWSADDGQVFARTVRLSAAGFVVTALLVVAPVAQGGFP